MSPDTDHAEEAMAKLEETAEHACQGRFYRIHLREEHLPRLTRVIERLRRKAWDMEHGELF